ncbi:hypothetical protein HWV62_10090 [Athelia sp. TMB]|nr:hypothetical protein HWV62_10090 [Athelia sp. TMB]
MANPRQRRKARSSTHKPVSHSRNAKKMLKKTPPIRGPKLLQDAWDKHKTVRQNYAALGLVCNLNPLASGGAEHVTGAGIPDMSIDTITETPIPGPSQLKEPTAASAIPKGYGKIIRDADGKVLRVEMGEEEDDEGAENQAQVEEEMKDPEMDSRVRANWVTDLGGGSKGGVDVVKSLERLSAAGTASSGPRHSSTLETLYLRRLVAKHKDDVDAMARDRRLNPEQRTVGQLRRGLKKAAI